nr:hypothetical protein [Clostridium botulinum]
MTNYRKFLIFDNPINENIKNVKAIDKAIINIVAIANLLFSF